MISRIIKFANYISKVYDPIYNELDSLIEIMEGMSRLTHQSIALVDFFKGDIVYISNNPLFLCGLTPQEMKKMGFAFNHKFVSPDENELIMKITVAWFNFIESQPVAERKKYTLQLHYHLQKKLLCVRMTPAFLSHEGRPWLVLCNATVATHSEVGNASILNQNSQSEWLYDSASNKWNEKQVISLNEIERQVLQFSIQGKKEHEICQLIFRSKDGLKSIKRRMFQKMEVTNITEAVSFAISHGLI